MKKDKDIENPLNNGAISGKDPKNGRFLPGNQLSQGKPKGTKHFATLIGEMIKKKINIKVDGKVVEMTIDEAMVQAMIRQVIKGDTKAFQALTDRHEGKPHQSIEMEVSEPPIPIMPLKAKTGKRIVRTDDSDE